MKCFAIKYRNLYVGSIKLTLENTVNASCMQYSGREYTNKIAAFCTENNCNVLSALTARTYVTPFYEWSNEKLYISSNVKTRRDIFRNSGFKIKLNPEDADYTVVPDLPEKITTFKYDLIIRHRRNNDLFLYCINRPKYSSDGRTEMLQEDFKLVKDYFKEEYYEFFQEGFLDTMYSQTMWLIPNCTEYADIIQKKYPERNYVKVSSVKLTYPNTLSVETLDLWRRNNDDEMLRNTMCASDYIKYPFTTSMFINNERPTLPYTENSGFRKLMRDIGYDKSQSIPSMFYCREIAQEDWNLWQEYIMMRCGLPKEGGWISVKQDEGKMIMKMKDYIQYRIAAKPKFISTPQLYDNIKQELGE